MSDASIATTSHQTDPTHASAPLRPQTFFLDARTRKATPSPAYCGRLAYGFAIAAVAYSAAAMTPSVARVPVGVTAIALTGFTLLCVRVRQFLIASAPPAARLLDPYSADRRIGDDVLGPVNPEERGADRPSPYIASAPMAAAQAAFLRSFDELEAILDDALREYVGDAADMFTLHDSVHHLQAVGFLSADELQSWSDCLSIRGQLLAARMSAPTLPAVEQALSQMMRLQVALIDRRRQLTQRIPLPANDDSCLAAGDKQPMNETDLQPVMRTQLRTILARHGRSRHGDGYKETA